MDIIFLRELKAETLIGVYDWERVKPQTIEVDLDIALPDNAAFKTDNIEDTINYDSLAEEIEQFLTQQHFLLLESLAEGIAGYVREIFGSPWIRVRVSKPGILPNVAKVGVQIERGERSIGFTVWDEQD